VKKAKQFDCVQMKSGIQQQIENEFAGLSDKEAYKVKIEQTLKSNVLGPFLRKIYSARHAVSSI
jgi:hypothetical protein